MTTLPLGRKIAACLALAFAFAAFAPPASALFGTSPEKQAHKVQSRLAKYPAGSFLHLTFRDGTESTGKLGPLSDNSFVLTNSDSNARETHPYGDVKKIEKGKEYIGQGSAEHHHHIHIF